MAKSKSTVNVVNPSDVLIHDKKFYRNIYLSAVAVALVVAGAVFYSNFKKDRVESDRKEAGIVYNFEQKALADFTADKMEAEAFLTEFAAMANKVSPVNVLPLARQVYEKIGTENEKLLSIFEDLWSRSTPKSLSRNFYAQYLAVFYENNENYAKALEVLKGELDSAFMYEAKLYLDLGRLHYLNKENEMAKNNFQHVLDNFADTEMAKMAGSLMEKYQLSSKESNAVAE